MSLEFLIHISRERSILLCCFYLYLLITLSDCQKAEGDQCFTRSQQQGVCTIVSKCPAIENDILHGKNDHEGCGILGHEQIVCCPSEPDESILLCKHSTPKERISARKCTEYKELAYEKYHIVNITDEPPVEITDYKCAFTAVPLIVGGNETVKNEFPHMALIGHRVDNQIIFGCGGTLISEQFVLTAAHCIATPYGLAALVRLGEHDLSRTDEASHIDYNVSERIIHPDYKKKYNDIGLLKLERQVIFNITIRPACLPKSNVPNKSAIATGWRNTESRGKSNVLLKVTLDIFSLNSCNNMFRGNRNVKGIDEESQICAGLHTELKDTCDGDSGGPLQIYNEIHNCSYTIVGIASFGQYCGTIGVYTRVYAYLSWIEENVWPNQY